MKKKCNTCKQLKSIDSFSIATLKYKGKVSKYRRNRCRKCTSLLQYSRYKEKCNKDNIFYENQKLLHNKSARKAYVNNIEKNRKRARLYYNTEIGRFNSRKNGKKRVENLSNTYIKTLIQKYNPGFKFSDISIELVEIWKKRLILKRKYYGNKKIKKDK